MYGFKIAAITLLASIVAADNLPACAQSCVTNYNGCSQFDVACICGSAAWIQGLACCVSQVCSAEDQQATIEFADTICQAAGITTLPQTATCASGAASSYSTGAATIAATVTSGATASTTSGSTTPSSTGTASTDTSGSASSNIRTSSGTLTAVTTSSTGAAYTNAAGPMGLGAALAALMMAV